MTLGQWLMMQQVQEAQGGQPGQPTPPPSYFGGQQFDPNLNNPNIEPTPIPGSQGPDPFGQLLNQYETDSSGFLAGTSGVNIDQSNQLDFEPASIQPADGAPFDAGPSTLPPGPNYDPQGLADIFNQGDTSGGGPQVFTPTDTSGTDTTSTLPPGPNFDPQAQSDIFASAPSDQSTIQYPTGDGQYAPLPDWTANPPGSGPLSPSDAANVGAAQGFPGDSGGLGQAAGYFPWSGPTPGAAGVGGEGGTLAGGDNIGAGPQPGSLAGLGSFSEGNLGQYQNAIGNQFLEHTLRGRPDSRAQYGAWAASMPGTKQGSYADYLRSQRQLRQILQSTGWTPQGGFPGDANYANAGQGNQQYRGHGTPIAAAQ